MKRTVLVALFAVLCLFLGTPVFAGETFYYPDQKNPMFEISFPDKWTTKFDEKGVLHAFPEGWEVYWIMTVAEGSEKDNAKAEEAMTKQIEEWIKDYNYNEKAQESKINDIDFWVWEGSGVDNYKDSKSFGKKVSVDYVEFSPKDGVVAHIISFSDPANREKFAADVKSILSSIKRSKK